TVPRSSRAGRRRRARARARGRRRARCRRRLRTRRAGFRASPQAFWRGDPADSRDPLPDTVKLHVGTGALLELLHEERALEIAERGDVVGRAHDLDAGSAVAFVGLDDERAALLEERGDLFALPDEVGARRRDVVLDELLVEEELVAQDSLV